MSKYNIYIATTKEFKVPNDNIYIPIEVGYILHDKHLPENYASDAIGENISEKNPFYCELTALYWMWKNSKAEVVGLVHYRRYLSLQKRAKTIKDVIKEEEICKLLEQYELILPKKTCLCGTVREQYKTGQYVKDYDLVGKIIKEIYPEYYDSFVKVSQQDEVYMCNIFIGKKEIVDQYCEWVFDILFELEKKIDLTGYSNRQKRVYGFLSERLFNVWIEFNNPLICEMYMFNTEQKKIDLWRRYIHMFEYKVLKIDYLKYSYQRRMRREHNEAKYN